MQLTPDYLISDCGCPRAPIATQYPLNSKENYFRSINIRFYNSITSSRKRLLPRRESLSDYYDKLLMNSALAGMPIDITKKQFPMQGDTLKHMKCAMNEVIRRSDKQSHISRNPQSANILDKKHCR